MMTVIEAEPNHSEALTMVREAAKAGIIDIPWSDFKPYLKKRLEENFKFFITWKHNVEDPSSKLFLSPEQKEELQEKLDLALSLIHHLDGRPFTFQRLCEVLYQPSLHHKSLPVYLKAILKLCHVQTYQGGEDGGELDQDETYISSIDVERAEMEQRIPELYSRSSESTPRQGSPSLEEVTVNGQSENHMQFHEQGIVRSNHIQDNGSVNLSHSNGSNADHTLNQGNNDDGVRINQSQGEFIVQTEDHKMDTDQPSTQSNDMIDEDNKMETDQPPTQPNATIDGEDKMETDESNNHLELDADIPVNSTEETKLVDFSPPNRQLVEDDDDDRME